MSADIKRKVPERQCIGCRERKSKFDLIRIVRLPDGAGIELDRTGKKPGRGAYICPKKECLKLARKRLASTLETEIPDEIFARLEKEIENA